VRQAPNLRVSYRSLERVDVYLQSIFFDSLMGFFLLFVFCFFFVFFFVFTWYFLPRRVRGYVSRPTCPRKLLRKFSLSNSVDLVLESSRHRGVQVVEGTPSY
jgi:predicted PurR-regulated permease PerM